MKSEQSRSRAPPITIATEVPVICTLIVYSTHGTQERPSHPLTIRRSIPREVSHMTEPLTPIRFCRACHQDKPLCEFSIRADRGTHRTICKACQQVANNKALLARPACDVELFYASKADAMRRKRAQTRKIRLQVTERRRVEQCTMAQQMLTHLLNVIGLTLEQLSVISGVTIPTLRRWLDNRAIVIQDRTLAAISSVYVQYA
jgi:hypothetical protein